MGQKLSSPQCSYIFSMGQKLYSALFGFKHCSVLYGATSSLVKICWNNLLFTMWHTGDMEFEFSIPHDTFSNLRALFSNQEENE